MTIEFFGFTAMQLKILCNWTCVFKCCYWQDNPCCCCWSWHSHAVVQIGHIPNIAQQFVTHPPQDFNVSAEKLHGTEEYAGAEKTLSDGFVVRRKAKTFVVSHFEELSCQLFILESHVPWHLLISYASWFDLTALTFVTAAEIGFSWIYFEGAASTAKEQELCRFKADQKKVVSPPWPFNSRGKYRFTIFHEQLMYIL